MEPTPTESLRLTQYEVLLHVPMNVDDPKSDKHLKNLRMIATHLFANALDGARSQYGNIGYSQWSTLRHVGMELFDNAVDSGWLHTQRISSDQLKGPVEVDLSILLEPELIRVSVLDQGEGMDATLETILRQVCTGNIHEVVKALTRTNFDVRSTWA